RSPSSRSGWSSGAAGRTRRSGPAISPSITSKSTPNTEREQRTGKDPAAPRAAAATATAQHRLEGERGVPLAQRGPPGSGGLAAAGAPRAPHQALRPARHRPADREGRAEHEAVPRRQAGE